jgi:hypothetical protein
MMDFSFNPFTGGVEASSTGLVVGSVVEGEGGAEADLVFWGQGVVSI